MQNDHPEQHTVKDFGPPVKKRRRSKWRSLFYLIVLFGIIVIGLTIQSTFSSDESVWANLGNFSDTYIKPTLGLDSLSLITADPKKELEGMNQDRINVLLMGVGGSGHAGAYLTDTIIIASYKPSTNEAAMLSIPRDLIVPIPGHGWRKINNLYSIAEANDSGTGGDYAKQTISQIFDIKIPYYLRIDFNGFEQLIDLVGGIDVNVPRTLSDKQFPIPGREDYPEDERYEHLYIEKGQQHFDGETALKYVRSRHAAGIEGSDFARAERQQLVIDALAEKLVSVNTLLQPSRIKKIIHNVEENIDTNMELQEMAAFAKLGKEYKDAKDKPDIKQHVLENGPEGALQAANYNGAFVLEPKVENFSELKFIAKNLFNPDLAYDRPKDPSGLPRVQFEQETEAQEDVTIEIRNGTFVSGLARANQKKLEELGYNVSEIGNAEEQDFEETVIYDFSNGQFDSTLDFLASNYTDNITAQIPLGLSSKADILIILGLDSAY